jgi:hypothetical protein
MPKAHLVTQANNANANKIEGALEGLANMAASDIASTVSGSNQLVTIIFPANTGAWVVTCPTNSLVENANAITVGIVNTVQGVALTTLDFIDDDLATNTIITKKVVTAASSVGAGGTARIYHQTWVYDSTDMFALDVGGDDVAATVAAASEAQFEAENGSLTALTTDMTITYRTGALTSGISYFITGT